jgi:predicted small lipoprotein YifL
MKKIALAILAALALATIAGCATPQTPPMVTKG